MKKGGKKREKKREDREEVQGGLVRKGGRKMPWLGKQLVVSTTCSVGRVGQVEDEQKGRRVSDAAAKKKKNLRLNRRQDARPRTI